MYSRNNDNHLQIELADLNKKRAVRVVAVDNGVFSFGDKTMGEWPFAVVTNPKPAYELTEADPLKLIQDSTRNQIIKPIHTPLPHSLFLSNRYTSTDMAQQVHTVCKSLHRRRARVPQHGEGEWGRAAVHV